ncbi:MAG: c-type cytochrome biogenesis protein CcmI [Salinisphaeraceae bacterium]|nr:c-type cytochrome biogenesis protein CcmI [Salinisphaeraceae bacterium]
MTAFLVSAGLLTLVTAMAIVWPWLGGRRPIPNTIRQRREANRKIYNDRLAQIEEELRSGRLSTEQAQSLRDEAGQHLVEDIEQLSDLPAGSTETISRRPVLLILFVLLLLPGITIGLYLQSDSWMLIGQSDQEPAWAYIIKRLEARVADEPEDAEALLMLARTRRAQGDTAAAIAAYAQLNEQTGYQVATYLADEAETRILAKQGAFSPIAVERLEQALKANPNDGRALWYLGLAALSNQDRATARSHWLKLSEQTLPDNFRKVLNQQLEQLGVSPPQREASSQTDPAATRLPLRITADPALIKGLDPETPIFVMARPADGSRAMLAVRKHRLAELPLDTMLTDGMNMAGGAQLSDYESYRVTVRIAISGDAMPQTGDPYTEAEISRADNNKPFEIKIDKRLP